MDDHTNTTRWRKFSESAEPELPEYRVLSGFAVVGSILALLSVLSVVHIGLVFVGGAAALFCVIALARISASPSEISGRRLALAGLTLVVFWTACGLAREATLHRLLDTHSRQFGIHWFEYIKKGEPEKALELRNAAVIRRPMDGKLLDSFLSSNVDYQELESFVSSPEVRALLALGDRAQVRHYMCDSAASDHAAQVYAVTYDDHGTKKSFLVRIVLKREAFPDHGVFAWRTSATEAPWTPDDPA